MRHHLEVIVFRLQLSMLALVAFGHMEDSLSTYDAEFAPEIESVSECHVGIMGAEKHDDWHDSDHPTYHHETIRHSEQWGAAHVTPWTQWSNRENTAHEFTACTTRGTRTVNQLYRNRQETMHSAFVPQLEYDIKTTFDGVEYQLGLIRNLKERDKSKRWRMAFVATDGFKGGGVPSNREELLYVPDVGFHSELVRQSKSVAIADIVQQLPQNKTYFVGSDTGRVLCPHPTYALSSNTNATDCAFNLGVLDADIGFQLANFSTSDLLGTPAFDLKTRVTSLSDTFFNGSYVSIVGIDLRARYISETNYTVTDIDATTKESAYYPQIQLSDEIQLNQYLGEVTASGFTPPLTLKAAPKDPLVFIQSVTNETLRAPHPSLELEQSDCSSVSTFIKDVFSFPSSLQTCFARVEMHEALVLGKELHFAVVTKRYSVSLGVTPDASTDASAAETQVLLDMSHERALRLEYIAETRHLVAWLGFTAQNETMCSESNILNEFAVYQNGIITHRHSVLTYYMHPDRQVYFELPVACQGDTFSRPITAVCGLRLTNSECYQDNGNRETENRDLVTLLGRRGQFAGGIARLKIWDRTMTLHEIRNQVTDQEGLDMTHISRVIRGDVTLSSTSSWILEGELAWTLDCRPDIIVGTNGIEFNNQYQGIRCVAQNVNTSRTIDFIPIFQCHFDTCSAETPYLCTDGKCVSGPDGCEQRSNNSAQVAHKPCPALVETFEQNQGISGQQQSSEMHRVVSQFVSEMIRTRVNLVLKSPTVLAYDDIQVQLNTDIDKENPLPAKIYTTHASDEWSLLLSVNTHRNHSRVPFAIGATRSYVTSDERDIDMDSHCSEYRERYDSLHPLVPMEKIQCMNGNTFEDISTRPWNCAGDARGIALCPASRPYLCKETSPTAYRHDPTNVRMEIKQQQEDYSNGGLITHSHPTDPGRVRFSAFETRVEGSNQVRFGATMFLGMDTQEQLRKMAHVNLLDSSSTVPIVLNVDPAFVESARTRLSVTPLHFIQQFLGDDVPGLDYGYVWSRAVSTDSVSISESQRHQINPKGLRIIDSGDKNAMPMTIFYCIDKRETGLARPDSWILLLYSVDELKTILAAGRSSKCDEFGVRFPLEMSASAATADTVSANWDGHGVIRNPFPVYYDRACVATSTGCKTGLQPCEYSQTQGLVERKSNRELHWVDETIYMERDALCVKVPLTNHAQTSQVQALSSAPNGYFTRQTEDYAGYSKIVRLDTLSNNTVMWNLCADTNDNRCIAGEYTASTRTISLKDDVLGISTATVTEGGKSVTLPTLSGDSYCL